MFVEEQWRYSVNRHYRCIRDGLETVDLQDTWNFWGYTCDICRVELSYFEMMYHCRCVQSPHKHDICITCIHSIVLQQQDIATFLAGILADELDRNCIQQIIDFYVGYFTENVLKY